MAKRIIKLNPKDVTSLGKDVDEIVLGSGATIDAVYEEYKQAKRDIDNYEDIERNLEANEQSIPGELKRAIREEKARLRELDRRIAKYEKLMIRRIEDRIAILKDSPGASLYRGQIKDIDRAVFRLKKRLQLPGEDIRIDVSKIMGMLVTLEKDSGIVISKPTERVSQESRRKTEESQLFSDLADHWKKVYDHAKNDPRVADDVEWITLQLKTLDRKFGQGESIRRGMERVARRIRDVHNRTKSREILKGFDAAQNAIRDFASSIKEYGRGEVTPAGIDRLQRELEEVSRKFTPQDKAEWTIDEQREFGRNLRKIRKVLESMRPKRGAKKNPKKRSKKPKPGDDSSKKEWLKKCTWVQEDGSTDYLRPRLRGGRDPVAERREFQALKKVASPKDSANKKSNRKDNPCVGLHFHGKDADELMQAMERSAQRVGKTGSAITNPKKRSAKKPPSESQRLIDRCQKLWDSYCKKPTKKNLVLVFGHLEKMKGSGGERVKRERSNCLRAAGKEAKRIGMK